VAALQAERDSLPDAADFPEHQEEAVKRWTMEIETAGEQLARLEGELARLDERGAERRREIESLGPVGSFNEQDAHAVRGTLERLGKAQQAHTEIASRWEAERESLERDDIRPDSAAALIREAEPLGAEERSFTRSIEAARRERAARARSEEDKLESNRTLIGNIESERRRRGRSARLLLGAGVLLGGAAIALQYLQQGAAALATATPAALLLVFGAVLHWGLRRVRADEWRTARQRVQEASEEKQRLREQAEEEGRRLAAIAARLSSRNPEELPQLVAEAERLAARTSTLRALEQQRSQRADELEQARSAALALLERAGRPGDQHALEERLRRLDVDAARSLELARADADGALRRQELDRQRNAERARSEQANASLQPVRDQAALSATLAPSELSRQFSEKAALARRYKLVVSSELPRESSRRLDQAVRQAVEQERDTLIAELGTELPDLPEGTPGTAELRQTLETERGKLDQLRSQLAERRARAGGEYDELRRALPAAEGRIEELQQALLRVDRFRRAAAIARETLVKLGVQVHAVWAEALNLHAAEAFRELLPHYGSPSFDPNLRLSFRAGGDPAPLRAGGDVKLSTGTLDQLHLIVRLCVARYLSRSEVNAPLILDDPFVHADDRRFRQGMKFLTETLAADRQVIVLSCHAARHRWLAEVEPELVSRLQQIGLCERTTGGE
jgi:hypothetical protein